MVRKTREVTKSCPNYLINVSLTSSPTFQNPAVPKMYRLSKIHKPGKSMEPILSGIDKLYV